MTANLVPVEPQPPSPRPKLWKSTLLAWLDLLAVVGWGTVLIKYWLTQKLYILIHPDYFVLTVSAGVVLLTLGLWRFLQLLLRRRDRSILNGTGDHIRLLPAGWCSVLLILTAGAALATTPRVFNSESAFQRGIADSVIMTRAHAQAFQINVKPEERSLIEWVRTLNVNPEPNSYVGQKAKVQGLVVYPPDLSPHYILVTRFVLTCCAADAYPVHLPVKLRFSDPRSNYPLDTWVEVEGRMISETLNGKRQVVIEAQNVSKIPTPNNPYEY